MVWEDMGHPPPHLHYYLKTALATLSSRHSVFRCERPISFCQFFSFVVCRDLVDGRPDYQSISCRNFVAVGMDQLEKVVERRTRSWEKEPVGGEMWEKKHRGFQTFHNGLVREREASAQCLQISYCFWQPFVQSRQSKSVTAPHGVNTLRWSHTWFRGISRPLATSSLSVSHHFTHQIEHSFLLHKRMGTYIDKGS